MFNHSAVNECITFLNDIPRNIWYRDHLRNLVTDKTVLEIGCGSGLLAAYALEAGAKHYYGIDIRANRTNFTRDLLQHLGYSSRATVWTDDFCQLSDVDIPKNIDILLCEQTGHQFQNNFSIRQFWQHAGRTIKNNYISLPDEWNLDVEIYPGVVSDHGELRAKLLIDDCSLPQGYIDFAKRSRAILPLSTYKKILSVTPDTADLPLEFVLDLTNVESATVVLSDYICYRDQRCNSISATTDWPGPVTLVVPKAGSMVKFFWDPALRNLPDYTKGYWSYQRV